MLSDAPYMTNPQTVRQQSEEVLVATSSIISQRQVTEVPPPLTTDNFNGSSAEPGAISDDQPHSSYSNKVSTLVAA